MDPVDHDLPSGDWSSNQHNLTAEMDSFGVFSNNTQESCEKSFANETQKMLKLFPDGFCGATFDKLLCWPPTPFNHTAVAKCFAEFNSIRYDDTQNATKECLWNGTWLKTDFDNCHEIFLNTQPEVETQATIYVFGYTISLITLSIAVGIFTYFKELRCLRNTIHMNLMWSYMLTYIMWILTLILLKYFGDNPTSCVVVITLLHYFNTTTFFWMFVEGLYLYILVVETLTRENYKLRVYLLIGWGLPMVCIVVWAIVKSVWPVSGEEPDRIQCYWFHKNPHDWIYQAPPVVVLLVNLFFLVCIMWVLITKLRSANTVEAQQYHKAAKALLVLMPLLGITYVITMYAPPGVVFEFIRAFLLSIQGFTVALFYCFLNTEVQNTVRHHFDNWKTRRSLGPSRLRSSSRSKDWSPRSRTESIRHTEWTLVAPEDIDAAAAAAASPNSHLLQPSRAAAGQQPNGAATTFD